MTAAWTARWEGCNGGAGLTATLDSAFAAALDAPIYFGGGFGGGTGSVFAMDPKSYHHRHMNVKSTYPRFKPLEVRKG